MGVWDTATPSGSDPANQGDDRLRELKTAIQESLRGGTTDGLEAVFPGANPTTAPVFHYRGQKGSTAARPAALEGGLYFNTTTGTLQRADGSVWLDLTENAAYEAIHQAVGASLASSVGVVTLPETGNSFNVSGTEAVTSIAGWSAGIVIIKWTQARTLTHAAGLYLAGAISRTVAANDVSIFEFTGSNAVREISRYGATVPTQQTFTSGSGTYTTPVGVRQLRVRMVGGGGGGGARTTNAGTTGGNTTFGSSLLTANGGVGGQYDSGTAGGPAGGTATISSPATGLALSGGRGTSTAESTTDRGGDGAASPFGGAGSGGRSNTDTATAAAANTGSGGGGAGGAGGGAGAAGGGAAGGFIDATISGSSIAATYAYAVGAGGAGGSAGGYAGAAGGSGVIIVEEIY